MKAFYKTIPSQIGVILRVYTSITGQKRMEVRFPHSTIDADINLFEVI